MKGRRLGEQLVLKRRLEGRQARSSSFGVSDSYKIFGGALLPASSFGREGRHARSERWLAERSAAERLRNVGLSEARDSRIFT